MASSIYLLRATFRRSFANQLCRSLRCSMSSSIPPSRAYTPPSKPVNYGSSTHPVPQKLFTYLYAFGVSQSLFTACELGIFDVLHTAGVPQSAGKIAEQLSTNQDATSRLLDVLVSLGLLVKQTGPTDEPAYSNTPLGQFLTKSHPSRFYHFVFTGRDTIKRITEYCTYAVREGVNQWKRAYQTDSDIFDDICVGKNTDYLMPFIEGMGGYVRAAAPSFLTAFDLNRFQKMCDMGGGTGDIAYTASMIYPNMKITVLDLPEVVEKSPHFRPSMDECPNQNNVTFVVGDFFEPTLPPADLYVLTHILHDWKEDQIDVLLSNAFKSLPSGGGILIGEVLLFDDKSGPLNVQLFSMYMLAICDGRERSGLEYKQLLEKHGFKDVQWKYTQTNSLDAVLAIKP